MKVEHWINELHYVQAVDGHTYMKKERLMAEKHIQLKYFFYVKNWLRYQMLLLV